jgi:Flp pilus assembly protein TadG
MRGKRGVTFAKLHNIHRFASDEDGNIAMTFSIALMVILALFGGAVDFTMKTSAQSRSQDIADAVALSVAAFVRLNDEIPTVGSTEGTPPGDYTATYFGYDFQGWVEGGSDEVNVNVAYDEVAREATVTVSGKTVTTFANVMGYESLNFSTKSVVNFETIEIRDVASVALVLDNLHYECVGLTDSTL